MLAVLMAAVSFVAPPEWVAEYEQARMDYGAARATTLESRAEAIRERIKDLRYEIPDPTARRAKLRKFKADIALMESQARDYRRYGGDQKFDFKAMLPNAMGQPTGIYEFELVLPNGEIQLKAREAVYDSYTSRRTGSVNYRFSHHRNLGTVRLIGVRPDEVTGSALPKGIYLVHEKTEKEAVIERVATEAEARRHLRTRRRKATR